METVNRQSHLTDNGYSTPNNNLVKPRHRWYYYKEGFSNELVQNAIEESELKKTDLLFDPFVGSGTVNLCASQNNYNSVGLEVNPFSFFLSKTKHINASFQYVKKGIKEDVDIVMKGIIKGKESPFLNFSTFSEFCNHDKWLFNSEVLNSFEGGYNTLSKISSKYSPLFKLTLINAAMDNCNAKKDGKCLRYKKAWSELKFDKETFINSFNDHLGKIIEDLEVDTLSITPNLYNTDSRKYLMKNNVSFNLCVTSPPYLNSFDYTDVYRPELFLGRFVICQDELKRLRSKTLCSHINILSRKVDYNSKSILYKKVISELNTNSDQFWNSKLSQMVTNYFCQMESIINQLLSMAKKNAQLWMIVANSAYFNFEIPTDLVLADIGSKLGWKLKDVIVLRDVFKRGSKYSPDINTLRESAIIFTKS